MKGKIVASDSMLVANERARSNERTMPRASGAIQAVQVRASASMGGLVEGLLEEAFSRARARRCECGHLILAVNAAGAAQAPHDDEPSRDVETHERDLDAFALELAHDAALGRTIAVADIAYSGGRERALEEALARAGVAPVAHESGDEPLTVLMKALGAVLAEPPPRPSPASRGREMA